MSSGKLSQMVDPVSYLTAYCIEIPETYARGFPTLYLPGHFGKSAQRHCGLGIERDVAAEIYTVELRQVLHHNRLSIGLPYKAVDFGMSCLAIYHYLRARLIIVVSVLDATLKLQHHRTSGIDKLYAEPRSHGICRWRLAMGS